MKKTSPAHSLAQVRDIINNNPDNVSFITKANTTEACKRVGVSTRTKMLRILASLSNTDFHKQMPDRYIDGQFLDVYYYPLPNGVTLYIKFKLVKDDGEWELVVRSMKDKNENIKKKRQL